ncbi:DDE-type integrase/transposase/recombinase, partial [Bacillus thuringiensis]|nr:DDE-type integrase/transposase/recombinase [Bacillus thuringiensis]
MPQFINTNKTPTYNHTLTLLKHKNQYPSNIKHQQIKYQNNIIKYNHNKLKQIINTTLKFKSIKT